MYQKLLTVLLGILMVSMLLLAAGCSKQEGTVVATVGDRQITAEEIDEFFNRRGIRFISAEMELQAKRDLRDSLIDQRLLIIGAFEHNLDNQDEVLKVIEGERIKFLLEVLFDEKIMSKAVPSEAEIKDWYVRMGEEIKASHIVVDSESTAQEVLQKLKEGGIFEELAIEYSKDQSVKRNQGDLGWFTWGTMVDNFQNAVFRMQPGEISAPVKTDYGYHIIKVIDRRDLERRPTYGESKLQIRNLIIERRKRTLMQAYSEELKEQYPITVEKPTCQFVLNKLEFLYPETIGGRPRWRNNVDPAQLDLAEKDLVLGSYTGGQLTLGQYLGNLRRIPEEKRPDFDKYDSLSEVIFQMAFMDILQVEAKEMGLEDHKKYKDKIKIFKELAMADVMRNDSIPYDVELDEGEVQEYYDTHPEEFTTPLRFHLLEIQVTDEEEARTYVNTIRSESEFKRIASEATKRPGYKNRNGDLGTVQKEQYPELFEAAENLKKGNIAGPVEAGGKYSVIWVKQRIEPILEDFNLAKRRIIDKVTKDKGDALFREWIDNMKKRIPIETFDDALVESIDEEKYIQPDTTTSETG
jgi:peptidyl-prolyl cis-trans isomerase C